MCSVETCTKEVHAKSLCQAHYRKLKRNGDPTVEMPIGRPRREGSTDHRKLNDEEKERRRMERKAAKTHCVHGHELTPANTYTTGRKQKVCRICRRAAHQKSKGLPIDMTTPVGPRNGDKTHCKQGHEYNERNTMRKNDGSRGCKECTSRNQRKRAYGLEWETLDAMIVLQTGCCAVCSNVLEDGVFHVDHFHDTGQVRGLLCGKCNTGLGQFNDSPALLIAAAEYLLAGESWRTSA